MNVAAAGSEWVLSLRCMLGLSYKRKHNLEGKKKLQTFKQHLGPQKYRQVLVSLFTDSELREEKRRKEKKREERSGLWFPQV